MDKYHQPTPHSYQTKLELLAKLRGCTTEELLDSWIAREHQEMGQVATPPQVSPLAISSEPQLIIPEYQLHVLNSLVQNVEFGVLLQGPQSEILLSNQSALDLLGLTEDQLLGRSSFDPQWNVIHEDGSSFEGELHPVPEAIRTKRPVRDVVMGVYRPQRQDRVWLKVTAIPHLNEDGSIHHVVCSFYDITKQRETEAQLKSEHALLSSILQTSVAAVMVLTTEGQIIYANQQAEKILGLNRSEITHRSYDAPEWRSTAVDGSPWPDEKQPFVRVMTTGEPVFDIQHAIEWPDGRRKNLSINGAPIKDEAGNILRAVFLVHDITESKHAEEALRQSQKVESLGVLAGGIAHDFNNLLVAMLGQNSLALTKLIPENPAYTHIEKAVKAAERAADLTQQLLAYSGRGQFRVGPVQFNSLITENQHLFRVAIPKNVQFHTMLNKNVPPIEADAGQMQQLVMNLIINAAEAIGDKQQGLVNVSTFFVAKPHSDDDHWQPQYNSSPLPDGPCVMLEVSDNGCGMSRQTLDRIFDPFFTTKFTGRGLGLAAVLGIVNSHNGSLQVYSQEGEGTTFRFYFPALEIPQTAELPAGEADNVTHVIEGTMLVIDDEMEVREAVKDILEFEKIHLLMASDGEAGLALFKQHQAEIDLVLLDLSMPSMNGREVLEHIRRIDQNVPIILSSGYSSTVIELLPDYGAFEFLQKPYPIHKLIEMIRPHLIPNPTTQDEKVAG